MLRAMTWRQFEEWHEYQELEPFDEERADLRTAHIVQTLANINRKKGRPPVKLQDCLLKFGKQSAAKQVDTRAQTESVMNALMAICNRPEKQKRVRRT